MANLQKIATESNVSIATVSRILNDDKTFSVSAATRNRVIRVANELGYKFNRKAPQENLHIGVVQMHPLTTLVNDPYYNEAEKVMEQKQAAHQFTLHKITTTNERTFLLERNIALDGILAIGIFSDADLQALAQLSTNIVFVDHGPDDLQYYSAAPNFELAVRLSLAHFIERGHRKIGYIGTKFSLDPRKSNEIEYRRAHFESITKQHGIYHEDFIIDCPTNTQGGYDSTNAFLRTHTALPTAFFVSTDVVASGVIRAIIEHGLKIPQDISLITFNNTVLSEYALVPLTSIAVNLEDMIDAAYEDMRRLISQKGRPQKTLVGCRLIARQSVADRAQA